jgi:hypothetical protein
VRQQENLHGRGQQRSRDAQRRRAAHLQHQRRNRAVHAPGVERALASRLRLQVKLRTTKRDTHATTQQSNVSVPREQTHAVRRAPPSHARPGSQRAPPSHTRRRGEARGRGLTQRFVFSWPAVFWWATRASKMTSAALSSASDASCATARAADIFRAQKKSARRCARVTQHSRGARARRSAPLAMSVLLRARCGRSVQNAEHFVLTQLSVHSRFSLAPAAVTHLLHLPSPRSSSLLAAATCTLTAHAARTSAVLVPRP